MIRRKINSEERHRSLPNLLEAVWICLLSGWYRFSMLYVPFRRMAPRIGQKGYETPKEKITAADLNHVSWIVPAVCRRTPWQSMCMVQALTAKRLLNKRGFPCTLYMGVARDENGKMIAHAWLRCGTDFVTGGNGHLRYAVTGIYGDAEERETNS